MFDANKVWFTSDTHFGHANIIKYSNRPFENVKHMNESMIQTWNYHVDPDDTVYHLGDFAFGDNSAWLAVLGRLNGKIHLIRGNHDKNVKDGRTQSIELINSFETIRDYQELEFPGFPLVVLSHFPIEEWNRCHRGSYHLHGHVHGKYDERNKAMRRLDVGIDAFGRFGFCPQNLAVIHEELKDRPLKEHHGD